MAKTVKKEGTEQEIIKDNRAAWEITMERLNKDYGTGTVIIGNQKPADIPRVSTGSLKLDIVLGGGLPMGRIVEVYGPNASGKTSLSYHVIAEGQKAGHKCAMIDMEHTMDVRYAQKVGVNMDELIISQPDYGEMALQVARELIMSDVKIVVIDSVAAMVPKKAFEADLGDQLPAIQGRMMSDGLKAINPHVGKHGALLLFTNQLRDKVGVMFGPTEVTSGGNALPFYAAVRLDLRRLQVDKENDLNRTKIKVIKSKVCVPFQEVEVGLLWDKGFDRVGELVDLAEEYKVIAKAGSWYSYNECKIGQGRLAAIQTLEDNVEMMDEIEQAVMGKLKEA
jgi:recombination protein RecA